MRSHRRKTPLASVMPSRPDWKSSWENRFSFPCSSFGRTRRLGRSPHRERRHGGGVPVARWRQLPAQPRRRQDLGSRHRNRSRRQRRPRSRGRDEGRHPLRQSGRRLALPQPRFTAQPGRARACRCGPTGSATSRRPRAWRPCSAASRSRSASTRAGSSCRRASWGRKAPMPSSGVLTITAPRSTATMAAQSGRPASRSPCSVPARRRWRSCPTAASSTTPAST